MKKLIQRIANGRGSTSIQNLRRAIIKVLTDIILTYMDTFTANSNGHIYSVVDEERHIVGLSNLMQLFGFTYQLRSIASLFAILDNGHT
jgi:hypothetical protein